MSETRRPSIAELLDQPHVISRAVRKAFDEAVLTHAKLGFPVASWEDGKVVWLSPEEVFRRAADRTPPPGGASSGG
jgi:hypothetical protein